jgi:hypothetical protein
MARSIGNSIADSLQLSLNYADRLLKELPADRFARFAEVGGTTVESNHPAFILGHLALYGPRIATQLGGSPTPPPASFEKVFSKDATCVDDPSGTIYPSMGEVVTAFRTGCEEAISALRSASPGGAPVSISTVPSRGAASGAQCAGGMSMTTALVGASGTASSVSYGGGLVPGMPTATVPDDDALLQRLTQSKADLVKALTDPSLAKKAAVVADDGGGKGKSRVAMLASGGGALAASTAGPSSPTMPPTR